ncbi:hypothetical protein M1M34_gp115 [Haloarcula tailed virus 2]|uniref:Uncharacterized protein n=1 Tax=Haloarcula tailed virus 2 TaxID=2877989 RepID=A0AAE8Y1M9_9CAUD|nr:hypothetical protein M1M34_gp115 [Haloarcula tailed virus 2]UBF23218.1 hypothetical protein HATV-2_gp67 [Haloarcula tailed virus 2]
MEQKDAEQYMAQLIWGTIRVRPALYQWKEGADYDYIAPEAVGYKDWGYVELADLTPHEAFLLGKVDETLISRV